MSLVWRSTEHAWHRYVEVYQCDGPCDVCGQERPCLTVDTSDSEYCSFTCCQDCWTRLTTISYKKVVLAPKEE